ncbi:MAG: HDOD domain-containing protein [Planctomycetes bacterium]|nr:HDOD domain-containing protein [Planctomycetota bacterium]
MGFWAWLTGQNSGPTADVGATGENYSAPHGAGETASAVADADEARTETPWWAPGNACRLEPIPPERPELATEARALESLLISHFDGHDLNMPPLAVVAVRTLNLLRKSDCDLRVVADTIAEDQVIAASVLRMTNSPLYRGVNKITALRPAVARLGTRALHTLMMHESLRAATFHGANRNSELARMLWRASLASAYVMRELSRFTTLNEEDAFLLGLLHDIGNVVVLRIALTQERYTRYEIDVDTFDYLCFECHQEFGELVADQWELPDTMRALISNHHTWPAADDPLRSERLQLQLTDMICAMLGYTPPASYDLLASPAARDLALSDRRDFTAFLDGLRDRVAEVTDTL